MNIGEAVQAMRDGQAVRRSGWNGKGMYLALACAGTAHMKGSSVKTEAHVVMWTAQKNWVPWLCSQSDLLAEDWELAE